MRPLEKIEVAGKTVLVRVDFNVPLNDQQEITDDTRVRFVLPTLRYLIDQGAAIVLASHLGRPRGQPAPELSLKPVAGHLSRLLERSVTMAADCIGPATAEQVSRLEQGEILLLENLRFHPGEKDNDDEFAAALAENIDVYVNDAFAVSHREHASVVAVTRHVPVRAAGFLLTKEIKAFNDAMADPVRPLVAIIGGAKVSSKLAALYNMLNRVNKLIIGGAMANTFLKARGTGVGQSKVEGDLLDEAVTIMKEARNRNIELLLPVDVAAAEKAAADAPFEYVAIEEIPDQAMALDIGPDSLRLFAAVINEAKTIIWNGPMGIFEMEAFAAGTRGIARAVAESGAFSVVGGGDTVSAVQACGKTESMSYISTGGGAFLMLMEGKTLPGVAALED